jgi:hypothetical protein
LKSLLDFGFRVKGEGLGFVVLGFRVKGEGLGLRVRV